MSLDMVDPEVEQPRPLARPARAGGSGVAPGVLDVVNQVGRANPLAGWRLEWAIEAMYGLAYINELDKYLTPNNKPVDVLEIGAYHVDLAHMRFATSAMVSCITSCATCVCRLHGLIEKPTQALTVTGVPTGSVSRRKRLYQWFSMLSSTRTCVTARHGRPRALPVRRRKHIGYGVLWLKTKWRKSETVDSIVQANWIIQRSLLPDIDTG
jgi:hypothetical protein